MNTSTEIDKIIEALSTAKSGFKPIIKNKTGNTGSRDYKYADLPDILDAVNHSLNSNGLCASQSPEFKEGRLVVTTRLFHKSGQWIENQISLKPGQDTPQGMGSAMTYGRRYGLTALLGICADDDDDGASAQPEKKEYKKEYNPPQHEQKKQYPPREAPKPVALPPVVSANILKDIHAEVFNHENEAHRLLINEVMRAAGITLEQKQEMAPKIRGRIIKDIIAYIDAQKKEEPMITFN